jgi:hypothetical protein
VTFAESEKALRVDFHVGLIVSIPPSFEKPVNRDRRNPRFADNLPRTLFELFGNSERLRSLAVCRESRHTYCASPRLSFSPSPVTLKPTDWIAHENLWAANPRVIPAPAPAHLPGFKSRRFSSHAEMNAWKQSLLL